MTASLFATPPAKCPRCGHWHGNCFNELPNELDLQSARKQAVCACVAKYSATQALLRPSHKLLQQCLSRPGRAGRMGRGPLPFVRGHH